MVDESSAKAHDKDMLTVKVKDPPGQPQSPAVSERVLKLISENQRLEGFSGELSETVRQHRPDWAEIEAVARRFGAQLPKRPADAPTLESLKTPR